MNTKKNQRFQETEGKIMDVYIGLVQEMGKEKVSVQDICKRCGINRSSFYLHFLDVPDLGGRVVEKVFLQDMHAALSEVHPKSKGVISYPYILAMLQYMAKNQKFYQTFWDVYAPDGMTEGLDRIFQKDLIPYFQSYGLVDQVFMKYLFQFFHAGFLRVARSWVMEGCRQEASYIADVIWKCLPTSILEADIKKE